MLELCKPTGDKVMCNHCGATISPYCKRCYQCGAKNYATRDRWNRRNTNNQLAQFIEKIMMKAYVLIYKIRNTF